MEYVYDSSFSSGLSSLLAIAALIGQCLVIKKCGEEWWKGLIPVYGSWVIGNLFAKNRNLVMAYTWIPLITIFFVMFGGLSLVTSIGFLGTSTNSEVGLIYLFAVLCIVGLIASVVVNVMMCIRVAKAFDVEAWFVAGLVLVPAVFWCILAFDENKLYLGPQD